LSAKSTLFWVQSTLNCVTPNYGDFPATEVWEYRAGKAPKKLFNFEPSLGATPANLADPPQNKFIHL